MVANGNRLVSFVYTKTAISLERFTFDPRKADMKAEDLDRIFDEGKESMDPYLDLATARRPGREVRRGLESPDNQ
jgi:hypothetical protein